MSLDQIVQLAPPPSNPLFPGTGVSWASIQELMGIRLPKCLDEFGRCYGSGYFDGGAGCLFIYNPYDPSYPAVIRSDCGVYKGLQLAFPDNPEYYPHAIYPEPCGLYPIAYDNGCGEQFYIILEDESAEKYRIVHNDRRSDFFLEFPNTAILDFFYDFLCNKIQSNDCLPNPVVFRPEPLVAPYE